jgi:hypothetical protein
VAVGEPPRDLDAPERGELAEHVVLPRHLDALQVDEALALDRGVEHVLDERLDPLARRAARVEHARRPGRGQQRALLASEEGERRVAVGAHGHARSRGRGRTSAAFEGGRPGLPRRSKRSRGQV